MTHLATSTRLSQGYLRISNKKMEYNKAIMLFLPFIIFLCLPCSFADSRCFLVNGGSSVSFFVSEDAPIGYNLGSLNIHGDASHDISLTLRETSPPIRIEPGTKNITLTRKLDKEGIEGPSSVTFTVLCDKRNHNEPSIHIPVTIRVTDVNDNAPKFIGGPFHINVSEQTLPGSTILNGIKATDLDQQGPYSTLVFTAIDSRSGKLSNLVTFANGGSEGRLILLRPIDHESLPTFNVTLRVKDQGAHPLHSDTTLYVTVADADDQNPRFQHVSYSAILPSQPIAGTRLEIDPEPIYAFDQDTGINADIIYSIPEGRLESQFFHMEPSSGRISIARDVKEDQLLQPITLVLKAEQSDNLDRYAISTLNIGRKGNRNAPLHFVQPEFSVSIPENSPIGSILFTALTSRPADKKLRFGIEGDSQGLFKVGGMGQLILKRALDYETSQRHVVRLWVTDGFQNASTVGRVNVINVNDWAPRFRKSRYEFNISLPTKFLGQIEVADGDIGDKLSLEIKNNEVVGIDENGQLYMKNHSAHKTKREMMFLVVAKDSGEPPREAFVPVLVRVKDWDGGGDDEDLLLQQADFDIKLALIAALALVLLAMATGAVLYFGYCRKRRKIQSETFQKRVLERNISNPLALHSNKLPGQPPQQQQSHHPNSLRRSNKIRHMMNITSPILSSTYDPTDDQGRIITPVDINNGGSGGCVPVMVTNSAVPPHSNNNPSSSSSSSIIKQKNVTWSPKVVQKMTPSVPLRSENTRITTSSVHSHHHGGNGKLEIDPDTGVVPLETYRNAVNSNQNGGVVERRNNNNNNDTMQSNTSLTLYF